MPPSLSIILVTHQSASVLPQTLAARATLPAAEWIVVDNASRDGSADLARTAGATVIPLDRNTGFAHAANCGAHAARGDILCFLNPDCLLTEATVTQALRRLTPHSRTCAVPDFWQGGGRLPGRQPGYTRWKILADILENNRWPTRWVSALKRRPDYEDHSWHWPLGACLFIPRTFFTEVGGLCEKYFLYMEDVELGLQIHRAGGEIIALDQALSHGGTAGSAVSLEARLKILNRARIDFARFHYGNAWAVLLRLLTLRGYGTP